MPQEILKKNKLAAPQQNPQAFVLGGQPGAGKSRLIDMVKETLNDNVVVINGDDYRKYHPHFAEFQKQSTIDSSPKTQEFAGNMARAILKKAVEGKYNVVIEGTFRTAHVPIQMLELFKANNYASKHVLIQTCSKDLSRKSCMERYNKMLEVNPKEARYTEESYHDSVCATLAQNVETVCKSGLVDEIEVFERNAKGTHSIFKGNPLDFNAQKIEQILNSKEEEKANTIKEASKKEELQKTETEKPKKKKIKRRGYDLGY